MLRSGLCNRISWFDIETKTSYVLLARAQCLGEEGYVSHRKLPAPSVVKKGLGLTNLRGHVLKLPQLASGPALCLPTPAFPCSQHFWPFGPSGLVNSHLMGRNPR